VSRKLLDLTRGRPLLRRVLWSQALGPPRSREPGPHRPGGAPPPRPARPPEPPAPPTGSEE